MIAYHRFTSILLPSNLMCFKDPICVDKTVNSSMFIIICIELIQSRLAFRQPLSTIEHVGIHESDGQID